MPADRGEGQVSGYHCWAECYLRGIGWVPVDASEAAKNPEKRDYFFGAHDENRVEFTVGREEGDRPDEGPRAVDVRLADDAIPAVDNTPLPAEKLG